MRDMVDNDFFLYKRIKDGDEKAIEYFINENYYSILKYCRYHVTDTYYAEDITQETFFRFFKSFDHYKYYGKMVNCLFKIASNLCKDFYKKENDCLFNIDIEVEENHMDNVELEVDIEKILFKLPLEYREIIILYYFQNLKLREIANILNISLPLVKYRMREAKKRLSEYFRKEGFK